jgi:predicted dehydrogenase
MDLGVHWLYMVEYVTGQRIREITAQFSTYQTRRVWRGGAGEGPRPPGIEADGGVTVRQELEEQADLLLRLGNGAAGGFTVSGVAPGHPNTITLSVDGPSGGFDWSQSDPNTYIERAETGRTLRQRRPEDMPAGREWMSMMPAGHAEGYLDAFRNLVAQAWAGMRGETVAFPNFADGMRGIALIEAAARSARERRTVEI